MASSIVESNRLTLFRTRDAELIASAALLTALQCRTGGSAAFQPLVRSFVRRLSQRSGQQVWCGRPAPPPAHPASRGLPAPPPQPQAHPSAASRNGSARNSHSTYLPSTSSSSSSATPAPRAAHAPAGARPGPAPHSAPHAPSNAPSRPTATPPAPPTTPSPHAGRAVGGFALSGLLRSLHPRPAGLLRSAPAPGPASLGPRLPPRPLPGGPFRSFAAAAISPRAAAADLSAAAAAGWHSSHAYLASVRASVRSSVLETLAPYRGALSWRALAALVRQSATLLPGCTACLPGVRQAHVALLSAINVIAPYLPVTLAVTVAELARSSRTSHADAGFTYLHEPLDDEGGPGADRPWWQALPLQTAALVVALARTAWLLALFAPVILSAPFALQLQWKRAEWMELLRRTLEAAGPAFIKWGQWAATRHDLFPPDMCSELEHLHTQAPGHKFRHTRRAIEEAFGLPVSELFEWIEEEPVASGSIGQIHRAVLSERGAAMADVAPGTVVAVKVRHPGVGAAILRDFGTMMAVAHLASLLPSLKHLRLEQTLSQFAAPLREQVDLSREAANLSRFNANFRRTRHVFFPVPLYPLVKPDVLVESFESGEHITTYIQSENNPYNHRLSELGSGTMLQMMLVDNLIHSDLHPGNILVRLDPPGGLLGLLYSAVGALGSLQSLAPASRTRLELLRQRWLQPSLVLLDVGMATELNPVDQANMVGLFRSFAAMDGRACGDWVLKFSGPAQSCPDPESFKAAMEGAFAELRKTEEGQRWEDTTFRNGADALAAVLELVRLHAVSLPGHICAVVVTTLVLEGWSNKLDPDHSVLTQVKAMFEPENVPWAHRIPPLVDRIMEEEANHLALA